MYQSEVQESIHPFLDHIMVSQTKETQPFINTVVVPSPFPWKCNPFTIMNRVEAIKHDNYFLRLPPTLDISNY